MQSWIIVVMALVGSAAAAWAQADRAPAPRIDPQSATYARCLERASNEPSEAIAEASGWLARGGGDAARHCLALAMFYGGRAREAAQALEDLAQSQTRGPRDLRAELLAQAGRAWLEANQLDRAYAALTAAQQLVPRSVDLLVDRAEVLAAADRLDEAIADLNRANEINPLRTDALVLRAILRARLGDLDAALRDATRAADLNPGNAEAFYERGRIHRRRGDHAAARADWIRALQLERNGPIADATRRAIQEMDLVDDPPARRP